MSELIWVGLLFWVAACGPLFENDKLTPVAGEPAQLELSAYREILITSGTPPATLPKYRWPSGL